MDINDTETVKAKLKFERDDQIQGVVIKGYHTDNGILNESEFMEDLLKNQQNIKFSGGRSLTSKWGSRARHKEMSHYGKDHVDSHCA